MNLQQIAPAKPKRVFQQQVDAFLEWRQVKPKTEYVYRQILDRFLRECQDPLVWQEVQFYFNDMKGTHSPLTVWTNFTCVRKFMEFLNSHTELKNDVYMKINMRPPKYKGGNKDVIPDEKMAEALSLFDRKSMNGIRDYAIFLLLQSTGMRLHEVFEIKVGDMRKIQDVRGEYHHVIDCKQKGGFRMIVKLHPKTYDAINYYLTRRGNVGKNEYLFIQHRFAGGDIEKPMCANVYQKTIRKVFDRIGLEGEKYTAHSIRYTAAYKTYIATGDEMAASRKLRHLTPKTIQYYTHNFRNEINAINDINIEL